MVEAKERTEEARLIEVPMGEPVSCRRNGVIMELCLMPGDYVPVESTLAELEFLTRDGKVIKVEMQIDAEQVRAFRAGERADLGRCGMARVSTVDRDAITEAWRERRALPGVSSE